MACTCTFGVGLEEVFSSAIELCQLFNLLYKMVRVEIAVLKYSQTKLL